RYVIFSAFALESVTIPTWLLLASLSLHGFCYVFFFVAAFIHVDNVAPPDVRASAQSLIAIVTLGFGSFVGAHFSGRVQDFFTVGDTTDWAHVFLVPVAITVVAAIAFLLFFKEQHLSLTTESEV
ncbi:MAG: MFS transporter, partial [Acidobacteriota bacterium]|nr:MFS transporter [Acidobacteriota bacterium]